MKWTLLTRTILPIAAVIFLIDRISKIWIVEGLDLASVGRIEVWPPFLNLRMAWNTGINFGIAGGGPDTMRWVLIAVAVVISGALVAWVLRRGSWSMALGAGFVLGGALGNAWDRYVYGAVADFINNGCCGFDNPFSYNIADVAIFAGAIWIALKA